MKRIHVRYDGSTYTIGGRELDDVRAEVEEAVVSGSSHWLTVNEGEGTLQEAELLITATSSIALIPMEDHGAPALALPTGSNEFETAEELR